MDNREIRIQSEGQEALNAALLLLWDNAPGRMVSHFCVVEPNGIEDVDRDRYRTEVQGHKADTLVLFWHKPESWHFGKLQQRKLTLQKGQAFVWDWLTRQERLDAYLDLDGSLGSGFLAFNESWGHVGDSGYAFAAIRPIHAWYGK